MKVKKIDAYKLEFKIILTFIVILLLTLSTEIILHQIVASIESLFRGYSYAMNLKIDRIREVLYPVNNIFECFVFFIILSIYSHLIFREKIALFLKIDRSVKNAANGSFEVHLKSTSKGKLAELFEDINKVIFKFNLVLEEQKISEQNKINLITSISHDLRTPLTSILGYLKLVDNDEYEDEVTLNTYVNIALNKTKRLKALIDNLFQLITLNNYENKISKSKVNIIELVEQLSVEHQINFKKANIKCRLRVLNEELYILGDSIKLARVFENLIFNCIKYSKCSEFMDILIYKNSHEINLEFINYGEPIPKEDLPHIFEKFYKVDKSRSSEIGGSGLGLAITKNIVELHGGKISVESNTVKTTFKIELPYL